MKWGEIGSSLVSNGLVLLGGALAGPAGAAVGRMVAETVGVGQKGSPEDVQRMLDEDPTRHMANLRQLEQSRAQELARAMLAVEAESIRQVNQTARVEAASKDGFARRARPACIWGIVLAVLTMVGTACAAIFFAPEYIGALGTLYAALQWPLVVLGATAGVYVRERSKDKALDAGHPPPGGLLGALVERIRK